MEWMDDGISYLDKEAPSCVQCRYSFFLASPCCFETQRYAAYSVFPSSAPTGVGCVAGQCNINWVLHKGWTCTKHIYCLSVSGTSNTWISIQYAAGVDGNQQGGNQTSCS